MQRFEWSPFQPFDPDKLKLTRHQLHQAIQSVSAVGRRFLPKARKDARATLVWVPGLFRMAGQWIDGNQSFRSSLSLENFTVYLADEKVSTIATFELEGRTQRQLMLWLEEQIGKLGLNAANLTLNLPYELPSYPTQEGEPFHLEFPSAMAELAKYYHNSFICLRDIREHFGKNEDINIWPHHFDQSVNIVLKDSGHPETDTQVSFGMSPGDEHFSSPYFYVNSWPFADTSKCKKLDNAFWVSDEWTGAVMLSRQVIEGDQQANLMSFYKQAGQELVKLLTQ